MSITESTFLNLVNEAMDCDQANSISLSLDELENWNSLSALSLMSLVDEETESSFLPNEMESSNSLSDIYEHIIKHK